MVLRRTTAALAASFALAMLAALSAEAHAGTYHVYSCRMPDGQAAPVDGWAGSLAGTFAYAEDTCRGGGALVAGLGDEPVRSANTDYATWAFGTPTGTSIAAGTLWRAGDADGGGAVNAEYQVWFSAPVNSSAPASTFSWCVGGLECPSGVGDQGDPLAQVNRLTVPAANLGQHIYFNASCLGEATYKCSAGKGDANGYAAVVYLYAADLTLEQSEGPHVSAVTGELTSAPVIRGQSDVAFDATDAGSGVYEAVFSVDGQTVQRTVVDGNGGRCRDVGQTSDGAPAFLYVQPCLASASADVPFDSTSVANGAHHLVVDVIDAAGNAAPVLDRTVTISNPPPPGVPGPANGSNASTQATMTVRWSATRRATLLSAYGRSQVATGRLTGPGGTPIAGAAIDVRATPAYAGAKAVAMSSPHTDSAGRFSFHVPHGASSRTLGFAYRAHVGDALPVVTRTLQLRVRAGVALRVSPHTTNVGSTIFFRGHLLGRPVPSAGKQLVLEARSPGSAWIEFKVVHTDARGRYRSSYKFKFPGPADYSFRARSEAESDYPYAPGASNVVHVHER
jgi:hypothetical protein